MAETQIYYHNIDLIKNILLNAKLNPLTTVERLALSLDSGDDGFAAWDSTLKALFFWTGTAWTIVGYKTFLALEDTPNTYTSQAGKIVRVNSLEDALEFHTLVKADIGLGNVDNTSDANKPVSTAQAVAIAVVQSDIDTHEANTSNPHSVTKAQVGLDNADNTSDVNKPISTATQTALNLKADKATTILASGNGITGGGDISTNRTFALDYTYLDGRYAPFSGGGYVPYTGATANLVLGSHSLILGTGSGGKLRVEDGSFWFTNTIAGGGMEMTYDTSGLFRMRLDSSGVNGINFSTYGGVFNGYKDRLKIIGDGVEIEGTIPGGFNGVTSFTLKGQRSSATPATLFWVSVAQDLPMVTRTAAEMRSDLGVIASGGAAGGELAGTYPNPTLVNSAVIGKVLTGYSPAAGVVAATDSIIAAIQKLDGNISAITETDTLDSVTTRGSSTANNIVLLTGASLKAWNTGFSSSSELDGATGLIISGTDSMIYGNTYISWTKSAIANTLNFPTTTAPRTINFPDATGTVALTSGLSAYLPLSGGTMSGAINMAGNGINFQTSGLSEIYPSGNYLIIGSQSAAFGVKIHSGTGGWDQYGTMTGDFNWIGSIHSSTRLRTSGTIEATGVTSATTANILYYNTGTGIFTYGAAPSLTGYVPYTGATANLDLGAYSITATSGTFAQTTFNTTVLSATAASGSSSIGVYAYSSNGMAFKAEGTSAYGLYSTTTAGFSVYAEVSTFNSGCAITANRLAGNSSNIFDVQNRSVSVFTIAATGASTGTITIASTVLPSYTAGGTYLVSNSGVVSQRTAAQVLLDIGAAPANSTNYVSQETPSGSINSSNVTFTLAFTPVVASNASSLHLYQNGRLLQLTSDYSRSGITITMVTAPTTGDTLLATYYK